MIGRRGIAGLSLLCALMFCAFAAQSASAQVGIKSTNTTAWTCVKGGGNLDFADEHCDVKVTIGNGEYGHEPIGLNTTTKIEVLNAGKAPFFKGTVAGAVTEVECANVASVAEKSMIHNVETELKHTVTGEVQVNFTKCTVKNPKECKIKEPITTTATFGGVEGLKPGGGEMGVEFNGSGVEKTFAELSYEGEKCSLKGQTFKVKGSVIATGGTPTQTEDHSGATSVYIPHKEKATVKELEEGMQTLEIAKNKEQFFTATFTTKMVGGNPITLTTTT
jgi:hypothetical protein